MNQLLEPLIDGLGSVVGWVIIAPAAAVAELCRRGYRQLRGHDRRLKTIEEHLDLEEETPRLERHEQRLSDLHDLAEDQQRALYGNPNDPKDRGMRGEVHDIHETVREDHDE